VATWVHLAQPKPKNEELIFIIIMYHLELTPESYEVKNFAWGSNFKGFILTNEVTIDCLIICHVSTFLNGTENKFWFLLYSLKLSGFFSPLTDSFKIKCL
jgi:hypothetical protein